MQNFELQIIRIITARSYLFPDILQNFPSADTRNSW